jgi:hypothetical protein
MLDWLKRRGMQAIARSAAAAHDALEPCAQVGEYQLLHKYLHDRYASRVVLTFDEIEDLLGFPLPGPARFQPEWWDGTIARRSAQSDSWRLANRSAAVNLSAQHVVFDRAAARDSAKI